MTGVLMNLYKKLYEKQGREPVNEYKSKSQRAKETRMRKKRAKMPMTPERRARSKMMKLRWRQKRGAMMKGVKRGTKVRKMYQAVDALNNIDLATETLDFKMLGLILDGINDLSQKFLRAECTDPSTQFDCEEKFLLYHEEIGPMYNAFNVLVESALTTLHEEDSSLKGIDDLKTTLDAFWSDTVEEGEEGEDDTIDEEEEPFGALDDEEEGCEGC